MVNENPVVFEWGAWEYGGIAHRSVVAMTPEGYQVRGEERKDNGEWEHAYDEGCVSFNATPTTAVQIALAILRREGLVAAEGQCYGSASDCPRRPTMTDREREIEAVRRTLPRADFQQRLVLEDLLARLEAEPRQREPRLLGRGGADQ